MAMWPLHQRLLPCKSKFAAIQAARALFTSTLRKPSSIVNPPPLSLPSLSFRSTSLLRQSVLSPSGHTFVNKLLSCSMGLRLSHGTTNLVISEGKVKFETHEIEPPKKEKWLSKKRFKMKLKKEKQQRKAANKRDPRKLTVKRDRKRKFANAEERIMYKLERARIKEALLIERLKRYEVSKVQGPEVKPHDLTGEERFYLKKMAQKRSNYVPVGRRGVFGGVILNMHMHWKKHETVEVICKPCKPGQVQEYAKEIARLSGGIPIQIIGDDTIIFYRGKDYVQPEVMSPIDTLSKKKALEKSKYEQSLESVRRFIAISEKELELYYRHIALYGNPSNRNPLSILDTPARNFMESGNRKKQTSGSPHGSFSTSYSETEADSSDQEATDIEDDFEEENVSTGGSDSQFECTSELDDKEEGDTLMAEVTSSKQYKKKTYDVLNL